MGVFEIRPYDPVGDRMGGRSFRAFAAERYGRAPGTTTRLYGLTPSKWSCLMALSAGLRAEATAGAC